MVIKFDTPKNIHDNRGSCAKFVNYMEKENKGLSFSEKEQWFGYDSDRLIQSEVRYIIDKDHQGIGKNEGKFSTGSINPTEEEWKLFGENEKERKENFKKWVKENFVDEFANNYTKKNSRGEIIPIQPDNIKIFFKYEKERYYKGYDEEVKKGIAKEGDKKEGFNAHIHFITARKTRDGKNRISPTTKNRKEFDRVQLITRVEKNLDKFLGHHRPIEKSFEYMKTLKNGTFKEVRPLIEKKLQEKMKSNLNKHLEKQLQQSKGNSLQREIELKTSKRT